MAQEDSQVSLLEMVLQAYQDDIIRDLQRAPAWDTIMGPCLPRKPLTRRRRWAIYLRRKWRRLTGWRIINETDHWHKREDCDGW